MGRFAFLPRLSFLGRLPRLDLFCRVLIFSAATYSHVTVASSSVACINADISASCVLSCKKGWQDLSPETRPIVVLACQSSRISAASNAMAISHWILRFGNNLQGSSRQKSRFALFCRFLHRVCGALRLVYVHVSVLNVSFCYLKDCRLEGEELKQIRTKTPKVRCNCTEQRVALLLKN